MAMCEICEASARKDEKGRECGNCCKFCHTECGKVNAKTLQQHRGSNRKGGCRWEEFKMAEL
jgi:hypothetical protein